MTERTPQSGGRGIRRTQAPNRLVYDVLGNPTYGPGGPDANRVVVQEEARLGVQQDTQVGLQQGQPGHQHENGAEDGVQNHESNGTHGSQVGAGRGSGGKAKSIVTNASSASLRLHQNDLEAKKKTQILKETLAAKKEELQVADTNLFRAKSKMEALNKRNANGSRDGEIADLELEIIDLQANFNLLVQQVDAMKESTAEKISIILEEKALNDEIIIEEDEGRKSSDHQEDKNVRVHDWIQKLESEPSDQYEELPDQIPAPQKPSNDMVSQLVTALGQAFGGDQQHSTIVTKQVDKDLPTFTGRPEDWLTFKSEYDRTTKKYHYDDSENIVRIRKYVKGPAKEAVNHLLANPANMKKIILTLEQRFGNPRFILSSLIEKAKNVKPPDVNRPETIVDYGTAVDVLVTNVIAFQMTDYLNNIQLLSELVEKLPAVLRREWYRWAESQKKENLEIFQTWLSAEVSTALRSIKPAEEDEKKVDRSRRHHGFNAAKEEGTCDCCGKPHHEIGKCY